MGGKQSVDTSKDSRLPYPSECLPHRKMAMQVTNKHFVTGNPIQGPFEPELETVVFGTGCFWGTEKGFWRLPGVYSTAVGYISGTTKNPSYEMVCSGSTGHNEVVQVVYDPKVIAFTDLLRMFWESHDPTQGMGQGNDRGTQYRSGIYATTQEQLMLATHSKAVYQAALRKVKAGLGPDSSITTELKHPAPEFFYAEDYHQQYLSKPGSRPYCSAMPTGVSLPPFADWTPEGMEDKAPVLPEEYWKKHAPKPGCVIKERNEQIKWPSAL